MSGEFHPATVRAMFDRDGQSCFYCQSGVLWHTRGRGWSAHHRVPRGMGGSKVRWMSLPSNGMILCGVGTTGCHGWVESHRDDARASGLLLNRPPQRLGADGGDLPYMVPARREDGSWWFLSDDGSAVRV